MIGTQAIEDFRRQVWLSGPCLEQEAAWGINNVIT